MALKLNGSLVTAVALTALVAGWMATGTVLVSGQSDSPDALPPPAVRNAAAEERPFAVRVVSVAPVERASAIEMRGRTAAQARVSVRAETTGVIAERPVRRGDVVAAGALLCRIEPGAREALVAEAEALAAKAKLEHEAATRLQGKGFESATRVATTKAELDAAAARVKAARLELERTEIRAPVAGIVDMPMSEIGDHLAVGSVCATLVDIDPLVVTGQISERLIATVSLGETATVRLVTGETVDGTITFVSRTADPDTRTFTVEVDVPNPDGLLREGVTASASIPLPTTLAYRLDPSQLTLADSGEVGVRLVEPDNRVRFAPITIVGQDREGIWVTGLEGTADVIVVGQDFVVDGQTVKPVRVDVSGGNS